MQGDECEISPPSSEGVELGELLPIVVLSLTFPRIEMGWSQAVVRRELAEWPSPLGEVVHSTPRAVFAGSISLLNSLRQFWHS